MGSIDRGDVAHKKPISVMQVTPRIDAGGVERGTLEIAQAIVDAGGKALVATEGGRMEARFRSAGVDLMKLPVAAKNPLQLRRNASAIAGLIASKRVDIIHARSRAPAWSAYWAAQRAGARFLTTYHGVYKENAPFKRSYNGVMARGDLVIAISEFIADLIVERHGAPRERIRVIPRGADLAVFDPESVAETRMLALLEEWGIQDDHRPVVMLPGRLTRWKGQTLFLEALARVKADRGEEAFLGLMVGGGQDRGFEAELSRRIEALGLGGCVKATGHCDDMPAAYRLASVVVSASLDPEAFGRVAVEAQAMKRPVLAAAHGGAMETVEDGVTGWLFEPNDAEVLAAAITHALTETSERRLAIGDAGRTRVAARFSIDRMQTATLDVYEEIAERAFPTRR